MLSLKSLPFFCNGKPIRRASTPAPSPASGTVPEPAPQHAPSRRTIPRSLRHRAPTLWLLLPLSLGFILARSFSLLPPPLWLLGAGTALAALGLLCPRRAGLPAACLGLVLLGCGYGAARRGRIDAWDHLPPREARLTVRIERIFTPQPGARNFSGVGRITEADTLLRDLAGQRLYFSAGMPASGELPVRSAEVDLAGVLEPLPRSAPDDTFDGYLANLGLNFRLNRGRLLRLVRPPNAYRQFCENTVSRMSGLLGEGVQSKRPDLAAVLRAMMLGQKQELSPVQDALFMHSGTMHLFAINGLHIGVVAVSLHLFLALLRLPRAAAGLITLAVLWLDVDTTGASPSAVRAFLLVAGIEIAFGLRRPANGLAALCNAALVVLLLDPLALFSASFQMSYGVVLAIMSLGVPLSDVFVRRWQPFSSLPRASWTRWHHRLMRALRWAAGALGIGTAASLVSIVTGVHFFHVFVPGAFFANLVLMPLAALVISAGFVSLACGLAGIPAISFWFNHAAVLVLWGIDRLLRFSSSLPGSWFSATWRQPWIGPVAFTGLLALCLAGYATQWKPRRGGFWPPVAWVALTLVFGVKFA